jgi:hypothetical protein
VRLLESEAACGSRDSKKIQRQQGRYKQAVDLISPGQRVIDPKTASLAMLARFDLLDRRGKVIELPNDSRQSGSPKPTFKPALAEIHVGGRPRRTPRPRGDRRNPPRLRERGR